MTPTLEPRVDQGMDLDEDESQSPPPRWRGWLLAAGVAVMLCGLALLAVRSSRSDFDFNEVAALLREMKQIDTQWSADVLSVHAGLQPSFDRIIEPLRQMPELSRRLRQRAAALASVNAAAGVKLEHLASGYENALADKVRRIEQIKSGVAILRNSSRYLPVASEQLLEAARTAGPGRPDPGHLGADLARVLSGVLSDSLSPDSASQGTLKDGMARLRVNARDWPEGVRVPAELLLSHLDLMLVQREETWHLLGEVAAQPTVAILDQLQDRFTTEFEASLALQQRYRLALIALATALLGLLAWAGWQLRHHTRMLQEANLKLKSVNRETHMLMIQSSKMSAIGQMVAGIAHEVNSPLAYVKSAFSMLGEILESATAEAKERGRLGQVLVERSASFDVLAEVREEGETPSDAGLIDDIRTLLDDGMHGIEQITQLILTLKNFSRIDRAKKVDFQLDEGLNSALTIARYMLKRTVAVQKEYGEGVPAVHCSPSQINQVFLNIITNAAQAMAGQPDKAQLVLRTSRHGDNAVRVDIQDNGPGIPPDVMPRIFEPFFTTKPAGEGTGAGLAICQQIIAKHGGEIRVESKVGTGTTFSIILPIAEIVTRLSKASVPASQPI